EVHVRARQHRCVAGAQIPRVPRLPDRTSAAVGRQPRPRAQPRAGQEPGPLHAESRVTRMPREYLLPAVDGIISAAELGETIDAIAATQLPDGNIPWTPGGHTDPWNMVEAAMALDLGGRHDESRAAYEWLANMQRADGGWHAYYLGNEIEDPTLDTNVTCYI